MHFLLAIDSYKGCLSSEKIEQVVADTIHRLRPNDVVTSIPVSDGGDDMLNAFVPIFGGTIVSIQIHDPFMRPINALYAVTSDGTAIIETARSVGISLLTSTELNPMRATTYGVGEMVNDALQRGCRKFIIGLGGSATSDCGIGFLRALVDLQAPGGTIDDVLSSSIFCESTFLLASDVVNPLCGPHGAAYVFARQKGATDDDIRCLERRAQRFAFFSARHFSFDRSGFAGAGAAGGLGYAFIQYLKAHVVSGAELLFEHVHLSDQLQDVNLVITGEGYSDTTTLMGKLPAQVLTNSSSKGVPVWLLSGYVQNREALLKAGFSRVEAVSPVNLPLSEVMKPDIAKLNIEKGIERLIESYL